MKLRVHYYHSTLGPVAYSYYDIVAEDWIWNEDLLTFYDDKDRCIAAFQSKMVSHFIAIEDASDT